MSTRRASASAASGLLTFSVLKDRRLQGFPKLHFTSQSLAAAIFRHTLG
jgi:hypothetical protein